MLGPDVGQIAKEAAAVCHPATDWPAVEVAGLTRNPRVHHFLKYNKGKAPYAEERYLKDAHRLYSVLDRQLAQHEFVADDYSIADIAIWPWVSRYEWQTVDLHAYANVKRWYTVIARRPAVQRATRCRRTSAKFLCLEDLVEHLKNIDAACDDARLSAMEKIRRVKD